MSLELSPMLALSLGALLQDYLIWVVFGAIVVFGLVVIGWRDVLRFSVSRIWALSSICQTEAVRKRILWITPLAMLGVIMVGQFQRPLDEMDAIRQTTKYALFATGLLIFIAMIILACTNLPREVDTRVIYTVVTKPTTRLEIVLGKVLGFARVAALILLVMGVFTYAYLHVRAWQLDRQLTVRLDAGLVSETSRPTLMAYKRTGLLTSRSIEPPVGLDVLSRLPDGSGRVWVHAQGEQEIVVPFDITPSLFAPPDDPASGSGAAGLIIEANVMYRRLGEPLEAAQRVPYVVGQYEIVPANPPAVRLRLLSHRLNPLSVPLGDNNPIPLTDPNGTRPIRATITPTIAEALATMPRIYLVVSGATDGYEYSLDPSAARLIVPAADPAQSRVIEAAPAASDAVATPRIYAFGREGRYGQHLRGAPDEAYPPIAVFRFRGANMKVRGDQVPVEMRVSVERGGSAAMDETPTQLQVQVYNHSTSEISPPQRIPVESLRVAFFSVPASAVQGGNFDVRVVNTTPGHYAGVMASSVGVVTAEQSFLGNLSRSLFVLWLLAVLVVTVSIFCSTFLSWPIAVVLTLMILLGHWGVQQLGDTIEPGLGRRFVTEVGVEDPAIAESFSRSVEVLTQAMTVVSQFLPDLGEYPVTEDIERGITLPGRQVFEAAAVTLGFGIPLVVLAYVFLKFKEVAP